ncbi:MAG: M1 family metallopeptidase [Bacteroidota bacterium]
MIRYFATLIILLSAAPSSAYWKQHVRTSIRVSLDDKEHFLRGFEYLVYTNNAPDTLRFIYVHLWPNAYKNDRTRFAEQQVEMGKTDFYFSSANDKGYIDSLQFSVNGENVEYSYYGDNIDIAKIDLPVPLAPGDSLIIETPFRVKIPKLFSRLGHNGQSYFISQWFPKPAVYDFKGWHPMSYLDQGEFYSEFGSYDVQITLPKNYILMASGNCMNPEEQSRMDSLSRIDLPEDTLYRRNVPVSDTRFRTVRFTEDNVHDFAWFADKRWIVRKDSIETIQIYTAFLPSHQAEWLKANVYLKATLESYDNSIGKYPYKTIKAVEGDMSAGGGMEYPTITIIDRAAVSSLPNVLIHEAGHNWFYGMLGSNERDYPWMDEGLNSFYEQKTRWLLKNDEVKDRDNVDEDYMYFQQVANNKDQPINLASSDYSSVNYGAVVYFKSALMLKWLEAYMGKENFETGMKSYFSQWKYKHPYPEDFRAIMQSFTPKNLDWFFTDAFKTTQPIDFKLNSVKWRNSRANVSIKNKSDFAAPVQLSFYKSDSMIHAQWIEPFAGKTTIALDNEMKFDKVEISSDFVDLRMANNDYTKRTFFRKGVIDIGVGFGYNRKSVRRVYIAPAFGYNFYDGFGIGLLCHNLAFPQSRFRFAFVPQFSTSSKQLNGMAALSYSWYPKNIFQEIRVQNNIKSYAQNKSDLNINEPLFARYLKVSPFVEFLFKDIDKEARIQRKIVLKQYTIWEQQLDYVQNFSIDSLYRPALRNSQSAYATLSYEYKNNRTFHPYGWNGTSQFGQNFIKLSLEGRLRVDYDVKNKSLYLRAFAGKFLTTNTSTNNSRYYLNTTFSGLNDYLFDGIYLGRNENQGFLSQQVSLQEGAFKTPTNLYASPLGRTDNWLLAINLKTDLPFGKLPIRLYADIATFADAKRINPSGGGILYNAGLELSFFKELLCIYAPLLMSKDYNNYLREMYPENRFLKSISFSINIQQINGLRAHEFLFKELTQ